MKINKPLITILMFFATLVLIFLFVLPTYQQSNSLQANVFSKQAEYSGKSLYYANIVSLSNKLESHKDALQKVDDALPSTISFAQFIYFFQQKGLENGLTVRAINFGAPLRPSVSGGNNIKNIVIGLNLSGTYQNFKNFVSSLEQSDRLFEINSVSFKADVTATPTKTKIKPVQTYNFNVDVVTQSY